jgi:Helix-turn-helix domain
MEHIGARLKNIERNIKFEAADPVSAQGFTQVPNFILKMPTLSVGAKVVYAMFISYGWHNDFCFPGQDRLAKDIGMTRPRVTQLIGELEKGGLIEIERRGQGKTNVYTIKFRVQRTPRGKQAYL